MNESGIKNPFEQEPKVKYKVQEHFGSVENYQDNFKELVLALREIFKAGDDWFNELSDYYKMSLMDAFGIPHEWNALKVQFAENKLKKVNPEAAEVIRNIKAELANLLDFNLSRSTIKLESDQLSTSQGGVDNLPSKEKAAIEKQVSSARIAIFTDFLSGTDSNLTDSERVAIFDKIWEYVRAWYIVSSHEISTTKGDQVFKRSKVTGFGIE